MTRRVLPQRRAAETFTVTFGAHRFAVSVGYYDGTGPAEIFVTGTKAGSDMEAVSRDGAVLLSLALQHGVPVQTIAHAVTRDERNGPASIIGALADQLAAIASEAAPGHTDLMVPPETVGPFLQANPPPAPSPTHAKRGAIGGKARAASLTADQRKAIASKAAAARWARHNGKGNEHADDDRNPER